MKIYSLIVPIVFLLTSAAVSLAAQPSQAERGAARRAYQALTKELTGALQRSRSPKQIEDALASALRSELWRNRPSSNTVALVLTNLYLLEKGLRETARATNTLLNPPRSPSLASGAPLDSIRDADERAEMLAYDEARGALVELWNRHQALLAAQRLHWICAVARLAGSYSTAHESTLELQRMLLPYAGCEFADDLSRACKPR